MTTQKPVLNRLKQQGLQAGMTFNSTDQEIALDAEIIDISYTGIRVKVKEPVLSKINGHIRLTMILPESGTPFTVHGILKHSVDDVEFDLHYVDHVEGSIDDLMFECLELDNSTVLIKTIA